MKKNVSNILLAGVFVFGAWIVYSNITAVDQGATDKKETTSNKTVEAQDVKPAEKIQVFLFHTTQRCATCIAIGKLSEKTVNKNFQKELSSGKIEFREINIDLPENKELAAKFKATGSALFINNIYDGQDHIKDDARVWQLTSNEETFIGYLSDKLKGILGETASAKIK